MQRNQTQGAVVVKEIPFLDMEKVYRQYDAALMGESETRLREALRPLRRVCRARIIFSGF